MTANNEMRTGFICALAVLLFLVGVGGGAFLISAIDQQPKPVVVAPPCKNGSATCRPWQRDWTGTHLESGSILITLSGMILPAADRYKKIVGGMFLTMLGSFFGALLGYEFGKIRDIRAAKIKAKVDFRDAVHLALLAVYPLASGWPDDVDKYFRGVFPPLQLAVSRFRPFVSPRQREAFDRAWKQYRLGSQGREIDVQLYHDYMSFGSNADPKKQLHDNVSELLKFSE